jgi:hypothetical protein
MADAGLPVHVLRKIAGDGSLTSTQRYLHPDRQSVGDAGTALSAHLAVRESQIGPKLVAVQIIGRVRFRTCGRLPTWANSQVQQPSMLVGTAGFEPTTPCYRP